MKPTAKSTVRSHQELENLLQHIPPHLAATFDDTQLDAIEQALQARSWQSHAVDIRLSVPFLWQRFYLVLLAGQERRSPERLAQDRHRHPLWTPGNALIVVGGMALGSLILLAMLLLNRVDLSPTRPVAPAGIPFKHDRASCEESGRIWREGECIDYEHDPIF